jgi:hypothetical protein
MDLVGKAIPLGGGMKKIIGIILNLGYKSCWNYDYLQDLEKGRPNSSPA